MNILIRLRKPTMRHFFVKIPTEKLFSEIRKYLKLGKYSKAITVALEKGVGVRKLSEAEICTIDAELIITPDSTHWDLTA